MNKNVKNILREKTIRLKIAKREVIKYINKSVTQNNNIQNSIKVYSNFLTNKSLSKNENICLKNKVCFFSGKRKTIVKGFNLSRYFIKKLILQNRHTNIKKNNW